MHTPQDLRVVRKKEGGREREREIKCKWEFTRSGWGSLHLAFRISHGRLVMDCREP